MNQEVRKSKFEPPPRRSGKDAAKPQGAKPSGKQPAARKSVKQSNQSVSKASSVPEIEPAPKPQPLDLSNGKALYKKYDKCFYNSVSLGKWVEATVIMVNEDGCVMIDTKEEYWFSIEEQVEKFKAGQTCYQVGEHVQYKSVTQNCWIDCKVIVMDPQNYAIQVSVKENHWMKVKEQEEKVRYPVKPGIEETLWEAGKVLEKKVPDVDSAEKTYRQVLKNEDDNVKALYGLAVLLRDFRNDYHAARRIFLQALEESPYDMKVLSDYADLNLVLGARSEAEELYDRLAKVRAKLREFEEETEESSSGEEA